MLITRSVLQRVKIFLRERKKERKIERTFNLPQVLRLLWVPSTIEGKEEKKGNTLIASVTATVQITAALGGGTGPPRVIVGKNSWRSLLPQVISQIQCVNHSPFPRRVPEGTAIITFLRFLFAFIGFSAFKRSCVTKPQKQSFFSNNILLGPLEWLEAKGPKQISRDPQILYV